MKLIDLYQKIANGELEEGTKIKIDGYNQLFQYGGVYIRDNDDNAYDFDVRELNLEVEIIPKVEEKEQKSSKIEELDYLLIMPGYEINQNMKKIQDKLNEVIRHINKE